MCAEARRTQTDWKRKVHAEWCRGASGAPVAPKDAPVMGCLQPEGLTLGGDCRKNPPCPSSPDMDDSSLSKGLMPVWLGCFSRCRCSNGAIRSSWMVKSAGREASRNGAWHHGRSRLAISVLAWFSLPALRSRGAMLGFRSGSNHCRRLGSAGRQSRRYSPSNPR